ncbi:MAG: transposase, partial [Candidatus Sericytochromatia bacterium]
MFYPTVGIDVAKHTLQAALLLNGKLKQKSCPNTPVGFKQLLDWLERHAGSTVHACLEATGRYHEGVASALHEAGYTVSVLNP